MQKVNSQKNYKSLATGILLVLCLVLSPINLSAQSDQPFTWYNGKYKNTQYKKILKAAAQADVILFGELHNNSMAHWMQWVLVRDLFVIKKSRLVLGSEIFETDQQAALDSFLAGFISSDDFKKDKRFWPNYATDYHSITDFAKVNKVPYIATNVPRRYARIVSKQGAAALDTLPDAEKAWICPLPFPIDTTLQSYKMVMQMGHGSQFNGYHFASAQAIKDATMADRILKNLNTPGTLFFHINGAFHSDYHESIAWYLRQTKPDIKILVFTTLESDGLKPPDDSDKGKADFYLVTDPGVIKSY
jgi:uncharacterized iron-regulated protein